MGRGLALGIGLAVAAGQAEAGPWTRPQGDGYASFAVLGQRIDGEDAVRLEAYGEIGVTSKWLLTAQVDGLVFTGIDGFDQTAWRATARRGIWRRGRFLAAVEAGAVGGAAIGGTFSGCDTVGGEARLSFGGGGRTGSGRDWFLFADAIVREHGNCRRQRAELGFGQEVARNWFSTSKLYLETGSGDARSAKVETVVSRRFGSTDIGLGYRQEFGGTFQEAGVILRLEHRF